jgi:hypothetical protein
LIKTGIDGGNYSAATEEAVKPRGIHVINKSILA